LEQFLTSKTNMDIKNVKRNIFFICQFKEVVVIILSVNMDLSSMIKSIIFIK